MFKRSLKLVTSILIIILLVFNNTKYIYISAATDDDRVDILTYTDINNINNVYDKDSLLRTTLINDYSYDVNNAATIVDTSSEYFDIVNEDQLTNLLYQKIIASNDRAAIIEFKDENDNIVYYIKDFDGNNISKSIDISTYDEYECIYFETEEDKSSRFFARKDRHLTEIDISSGQIINSVELDFDFNISDMTINNSSDTDFILISNYTYRVVDFETGTTTFSKTFTGKFIGIDSSNTIYSIKSNGFGVKLYKKENDSETVIYSSSHTMTEIAGEPFTYWRYRTYSATSTPYGFLDTDNNKIAIAYFPYFHVGRWYSDSDDRRTYKGYSIYTLMTDTDGNIIKNLSRSYTERSSKKGSEFHSIYRWRKYDFQKIDNMYVVYHAHKETEWITEADSHSFAFDENMNKVSTFNVQYPNENDFDKFYDLYSNKSYYAHWSFDNLTSTRFHYYYYHNKNAHGGNGFVHKDYDEFAVGLSNNKRYFATEVTKNSWGYNIITNTLYDAVTGKSITGAPVKGYTYYEGPDDKLLAMNSNEMKIVDFSLETPTINTESKWTPFTYNSQFRSSDSRYHTYYYNDTTNKITKFRTLRYPESFYKSFTKKFDSFNFRDNTRKFISIITKDNLQITQDEINNIINTVNSKNAKIIFFGDSNNESIGKELATKTDGIYYNFDTIDDAYEKIKKYIANYKPIVSISSPFNNSLFSEKTGYNEVIISGTIKDDDINDNLILKYTIKNSMNNPLIGYENVTIQNNIIADGTEQQFNDFTIVIDNTISEGDYTLKVWGEDQKGGKSQDITISFKVDKTGPIVSTSTQNIVIPINSYVVVAASATDVSNPENDVPIGFLFENTNISGSGISVVSSSAIHIHPDSNFAFQEGQIINIIFNAKDKVGNKTEAQIKIKIDSNGSTNPSEL